VTPYSDLFDLTGRKAVVTGCSRGIGEAMAVALAAFGAEVIGASTSLAPGSEVEATITSRGGVFHPYSVDFSNRSATYRFALEVERAHSPIDILVNNAGTIYREPAAQHKDGDWDRVLEVNLSCPFVLAREFGRSMLERGAGKIIFTASLLSFQGGITVPSYTASKSAVNGLVKALANEWAALGVNVNAIAPGYIRTDNTEALRSDAERSRSIVARIPAGRWGEPRDLAGAVVFLASDASAYVHGTTLIVDGGWMGR
jgi:2-deoxy-D-gluconate 3-dehydrogenase